MNVSPVVSSIARASNTLERTALHHGVRAVCVRLVSGVTADDVDLDLVLQVKHVEVEAVQCCTEETQAHLVLGHL